MSVSSPRRDRRRARRPIVVPSLRIDAAVKLGRPRRRRHRHHANLRRPLERRRRDVDIVQQMLADVLTLQNLLDSRTASSAARSNSACSSYSSDTAMLGMPNSAPSVAPATVPE